MLEITVKPADYFNEETQEFITIEKPLTIQMEHSLISISKWEERWCIPYFTDKEKKSQKQVLDYLRCMTINKNVNPDIFIHLDAENIKKIEEYIENKHSATWFSNDNKKFVSHGGRNSEIVTSEVIYYWMIALQIPFECEKWHINRLITLIRVCQEKQEATNKKMSKADLLKRNRDLNMARRAAMKSKG